MIKQNIKKINSYIHQEKEMTLTMISTILTALEAHAVDPLDKIIHEYEDSVNTLEINTTQCCIQTLALYQPEAKFLRLVVTGLQISYAIERIADVIVNTAKTFEPIIHKEFICYEDLKKMILFTLHMIDDSTHAFLIGDSNKARTILSQDKEVDMMRDAIINSIMKTTKSSDKISIEEAVAIIHIAQNIERMGDITTTIAKHVVYLKDGEVIEHHS